MKTAVVGATGLVGSAVVNIDLVNNNEAITVVKTLQNQKIGFEYFQRRVFPAH